MLETAGDYLNPLTDMTIEIQRENMHLSDVLLMVNSLHNRLQADVVDEPAIITRMSRTMLLKQTIEYNPGGSNLIANALSR